MADAIFAPRGGGSGRFPVLSALLLAAAGVAPASATTVSAADLPAAPTAVVALHPRQRERARRYYPTVEQVQARREAAAGSSASTNALTAPVTPPQLTYGGGRGGIGVTLAPKVYVV